MMMMIMTHNSKLDVPLLLSACVTLVPQCEQNRSPLLIPSPQEIQNII